MNMIIMITIKITIIIISKCIIIVIYVKNMNFGIFTRRGWRRSSWWCYSGAFWQRHIRPGQRKRAAYIFSPAVHCLWKWIGVYDEIFLSVKPTSVIIFTEQGGLGEQLAWNNGVFWIWTQPWCLFLSYPKTQQYVYLDKTI